jgi:hypothetical protein
MPSKPSAGRWRGRPFRKRRDGSEQSLARHWNIQLPDKEENKAKYIGTTYGRNAGLSFAHAVRVHGGRLVLPWLVPVAQVLASASGEWWGRRSGGRGDGTWDHGLA